MLVSYERGTPVDERRLLWLRARVFTHACMDHRGTSLTRKLTPLGPYRRPMPRVLEGSYEGGRFLIGEIPHIGRVQGDEVPGVQTLHSDSELCLAELVLNMPMDNHAVPLRGCLAH